MLPDCSNVEEAGAENNKTLMFPSIYAVFKAEGASVKNHCFFTFKWCGQDASETMLMDIIRAFLAGIRP